MVLVMLAIKKRENEERGNENSVRKKEHFIKYQQAREESCLEEGCRTKRKIQKRVREKMKLWCGRVKENYREVKLQSDGKNILEVF